VLVIILAVGGAIGRNSEETYTEVPYPRLPRVSEPSVGEDDNEHEYDDRLGIEEEDEDDLDTLRWPSTLNGVMGSFAAICIGYRCKIW
jgi:hypothetical protein